MKQWNKKIHGGNEKLFSKSAWVPIKQLIGEKKVLNHPLLHTAFFLILKKHIPKYKTVLLSLCTATRPYSAGRKWKKYIEEFGNRVDLVVISNGGIVPKEFWYSYPFLNYDAGIHEDDALYKKLMYERMMKFFKKHKYDYVVANFSPRQRNFEPAEQSLSKLKADCFIKDYTLVPDQTTYMKAQKQGWVGGRMFPDLHPIIFQKITEYINMFSSKEKRQHEK
jgi:hypothetical protein